MYGKDNVDPVVKYNDVTIGSTCEDELNWYKSKVKQFGGPIPDLVIQNKLVLCSSENQDRTKIYHH